MYQYDVFIVLSFLHRVSLRERREMEIEGRVMIELVVGIS